MVSFPPWGPGACFSLPGTDDSMGSSFGKNSFGRPNNQRRSFRLPPIGFGLQDKTCCDMSVGKNIDPGSTLPPSSSIQNRHVCNRAARAG